MEHLVELAGVLMMAWCVGTLIGLVIMAPFLWRLFRVMHRDLKKMDEDSQK